MSKKWFSNAPSREPLNHWRYPGEIDRRGFWWVAQRFSRLARAPCDRVDHWGGNDSCWSAASWNWLMWIRPSQWSLLKRVEMDWWANHGWWGKGRSESKNWILSRSGIIMVPLQRLRMPALWLKRSLRWSVGRPGCWMKMAGLCSRWIHPFRVEIFKYGSASLCCSGTVQATKFLTFRFCIGLCSLDAPISSRCPCRWLDLPVLRPDEAASQKR